MSADPESYGVLAKVIAAGTAIAAPIGWLWAKLDGKLSKGDFKEFVDRFDDHVKRDQEIQGKLFDQMRDNEQRAQDRYERLMEKLPK